MTNQNEVKKIDVAEAVFAEVHLQAVEKPRKEFIARLIAALGEENCSHNLAASYYQMLKYEADGKGTRYKHHKRTAKATVEVAEEPIAIVPSIPEDAKWQAVKDDAVQYFSNRDAARAYAKANEGYKVSKIA